MPVGATIAGIGAAASIGSAAIGSSAAKSAAKTQATAASNAADMQLNMFNTIRDDLAPYRQVGATALPGIQALLGLTGGQGINVGGVAGATAAPGTAGSPFNDYADYVRNNPDLAKVFAEQPNAFNANGDINAWGKAHWDQYGSQPGEVRNYTPTTLSAQQQLAGTYAPKTAMQTYLESLPGYQFTKQQGLQAVENSMNAKGLGGLSGSLGKGIARFVTGLADQTYQQQLGNFTQLAGIGQSAANQTGAFGTQATQGAAGSLIGGANASAAGTVGSAGAISSGLTGVANSAITSQLLGMYGKTGGGTTPTYGQGGYGWTPSMGG
jgi:hypothetical protein